MSKKLRHGALVYIMSSLIPLLLVGPCGIHITTKGFMWPRCCVFTLNHFHYSHFKKSFSLGFAICSPILYVKYTNADFCVWIHNAWTLLGKKDLKSNVSVHIRTCVYATIVSPVASKSLLALRNDAPCFKIHRAFDWCTDVRND